MADVSKFWQTLGAAGRDVLKQAESIGFGQIVLEIKFADGVPLVATTIRSTSKRYMDSDSALQDIARMLNVAQSHGFKGQQRFNVDFSEGQIKRVVVDEAATENLQYP